MYVKVSNNNRQILTITSLQLLGFTGYVSYICRNMFRIHNYFGGWYIKLQSGSRTLALIVDGAGCYK